MPSSTAVSQVAGRDARRASKPVFRVAIATVALVLLSGCGNDSTADGGAGVTPTTAGSPELTAAIADAQRIAPALESELRGTEYPTTLDAARKALADAGIEPTSGNVVKGYAYDPDTVEFSLCIEGPTGAFASYDTRPMALFTTGETGGCPAS